MKLHVFFICLGIIIKCWSQELPHQKGKVIDSIAVQEKPGESFALYLPKHLDPAIANPVLFIFDPAGRGSVGIKPFIKAAEEYGLILVCSNNSRNMAYEENFGISERWFNQVLFDFKIDQKRIYAAGFSGGSRLASTIGVLSGLFRSVIACGAGFSGNAGQIPYNNAHFNYVGIVGDQDMNYQEMFQVQDWLNNIGLINQLYIFKGDHRWPDPELVLKSFDWIYLQDYLQGLVQKDENFLRTYLSDELRRADNLQNNGQLLLAVKVYENTLDDLGSEFELDSIADKIREIKTTKAFRNAQKATEEVAVLEKEWTDKLIGRIRKETEKQKIPADFKWWNKELEKLAEEYTRSENEIYSNLGKRLQSMIFAVCIEDLEATVAVKNEFEVEYYASLLQANWSDNAWIYFRIARAYALLNKDDKAIYSLQMAVSKGWESKPAILNTRAFDHLRENQEFQALMEQFQ